MKSLLQKFAITAFAVLASAAFAQEQAVTKRATELREKPASDAKTLANLPEKTPLKVLARSGGWTQVEAGTQKGWVNVFHLTFASTVTSSSGSGGLSGLTSALGFGKPKTEQAKMATIGVRGLSEEELKNASPNPEALKKMQSFRADKNAAASFARDAKLAAQNVPYPGNP
ncbi:SH3 domain-containing protein [Usitatibacter palustris]|nr:SH3 domain-containing protein [Usitatibacter palustris]